MAGEASTIPNAPARGVTPPEKTGEETEKDALSVPPEFIIDDEFKALIPPLDPCAKESLKASLQKEGCRDRLVICKLDDQYVLLDGHNRYEICDELEIPFQTKEVSVSSRTEAQIWIIKNQRGRRNLNESQRAMLAVRLEALYAEEAKGRMGTRTDLGQNLDRGELGRSAEKAAKEMGVSHQTVISAKNVMKKGIPELAGLVKTGKVAVSAAVKAVSLPDEIQQKVVEKVEERVKEGKRANIAAIIHEVVPRTSEEDVKVRFVKAKKNLEGCLKQLQGVEAVDYDELIEMRAFMDKLMARLDEIEGKSPDHPDPISQDIPPASNNHEIATKEEQKETDPDSSEPMVGEADAVSYDDEEELSDGSLNYMDNFGEMPEGWGEYGDAIEHEMEN